MVPTRWRPNSSPAARMASRTASPVCPWPEQLQSGLSGHAVPKGAHRFPGDGEPGHGEELHGRGGLADESLDQGQRVRALELVAVQLRRPPAAVWGRWVPAHLDVVAAGRRLVLDPVDGERLADQIERVRLEMEQDVVADEQAVPVHGHEVLGLADRVVVDPVDPEVLEQPQRVRTGDEQVVHVVRLVEQGDRLAPGALLGHPVRVLGCPVERHGRDARIPEQIDGIARRSSAPCSDSVTDPLPSPWARRCGPAAASRCSRGTPSCSR